MSLVRTSLREVKKSLGAVILLLADPPFISSHATFSVLLNVLSVFEMKELLKGYTITAWFCLGEIQNTRSGVGLEYLQNFLRRILIDFLFSFSDRRSKACLQSV